MDTEVLKALLHTLIGALPSPGSVSLTAGFETWLGLHQGRGNWETDPATSTGQSGGVIRGSFITFFHSASYQEKLA